jgi:hypothetical protein
MKSPTSIILVVVVDGVVAEVAREALFKLSLVLLVFLFPCNDFFFVDIGFPNCESCIKVRCVIVLWRGFTSCVLFFSNWELLAESG